MIEPTVEILKVSEFQKLLSQILSEYGDIPVFWQDSDGGTGPLKKDLSLPELIGRDWDQKEIKGPVVTLP